MSEVILFIQKELSGWTKNEKIFAPILLLLLISLSFYMNDSIIATVQASFSFLYTIFAGKGKISCYIFGIFGTLCYSFLAFKNALYGNLMLHSGYFFPMEIIGIFAWKGKLKAQNNEVIKTHLNQNERLLLFLIIMIISIVFSFFLRIIGDKFPIMDAFSTVLSIGAMYLTIRRCIEQWVLWTVVNILSIIMWLLIFIDGSNTFATMLIWIIHLFLGIYFFIQWKEEMFIKN